MRAAVCLYKYALDPPTEGINVKEGVRDEEGAENDATIALQKRMIAARSWEGNCDSNVGVVKCLASFLNVGTSGTKKRKLD